MVTESFQISRAIYSFIFYNFPLKQFCINSVIKRRIFVRKGGYLALLIKINLRLAVQFNKLHYRTECKLFINNTQNTNYKHVHEKSTINSLI